MKTVSKSFRLTPDTIRKIEEWPGDTFTQKFMNMVDTVFDRREMLQQDIKLLELRRTKLTREIAELQSVKNGLARLRDSLNRTNSMIFEVEKTAKQLHDCMERIGEDQQ